MKKLITLLTVCCLAIMQTGCSKGLSGTYKHEGSGQIIEFKKSADFKLRYPKGTVVAGTYKKTEAGYELIRADGSAFAVIKKEGKALRMGSDQFIKQKEKFRIPVYLQMIYFLVFLMIFVWGNAFSILEKTISKYFVDITLCAIFWPICLIIIVLMFFLMLLWYLACKFFLWIFEKGRKVFGISIF